MSDGEFIVADKLVFSMSGKYYPQDNVDLRKLTFNETKEFFIEKKIPRFPEEHNCKFEYNTETKIVNLVATKDIAPDDELCLDYTVSSWIPRFIFGKYIDYNYQIENVKL
jgi:hypothetical protein